MTFNAPWHAIQGHLAGKEQTRENSARLAVSQGFLTTTGSGERQEAERVPFGCVFAEAPAVAFGWSMDGDELVDGQFPRVSAGVYGWDTDQKGHYLGAYIMVTVDVPTGAEEPEYGLNLFFTFTGTAIKDIPDYLLDE